MRAVVQRVVNARVDVDNVQIAEIGNGMVVLLCAMRGDTEENARAMAQKLSKLRIFRDDSDRMNRAIADIDGAALVVSQFTLAADTSRGNRPGFSQAAAPEEGKRLYELTVAELRATGVSLQTGRFGADMALSLTNDGPVTLWVET